MTVRNALRGSVAAMMFFTRLPIGRARLSREDWPWAAAWLPVVGAVVGALMAAVWTLVSPLGVLPAGVLTYASGLFATGALHEDGLADTADALGGGVDREHMFRILKDSRVGTYGALALAVSLLLRVGLLAQVPTHAVEALLVSQVLSRVPPVCLLTVLPYVSPEGTSKSWPLVSVGWRQTVLAVGLASASVYWPARATGWGPVLLATLVAAGIALWSAYWFRTRLGGVTGDLLGAAQQVSELGTLATLVSQLR